MVRGFAYVSMASKRGGREFTPTTPQLLKHPLTFVALVPKEDTIFAAGAITGAIAGAAAKSVTVPLDRIKLLMQHKVYRPNLDFLEENDDEVDLT